MDKEQMGSGHAIIGNDISERTALTRRCVISRSFAALFSCCSRRSKSRLGRAVSSLFSSSWMLCRAASDRERWKLSVEADLSVPLAVVGGSSGTTTAAADGVALSDRTTAGAILWRLSGSR